MHNKMGNHLVIFSVERPDIDSLDNLKNSASIAELLSLRGIKFTPCEGAYKGVREHSFCCYLPKNPNDEFYVRELATIESVCRDYRQESYLHVSPEYTGRLVFLHDGHVEPLGRASFVSELPEGTEAYTEFPGGPYLLVGA